MWGGLQAQFPRDSAQQRPHLGMPHGPLLAAHPPCCPHTRARRVADAAGAAWKGWGGVHAHCCKCRRTRLAKCTPSSPPCPLARTCQPPRARRRYCMAAGGGVGLGGWEGARTLLQTQANTFVQMHSQPPTLPARTHLPVAQRKPPALHGRGQGGICVAATASYARWSPHPHLQPNCYRGPLPRRCRRLCPTPCHPPLRALALGAPRTARAEGGLAGAAGGVAPCGLAVRQAERTGT